MVRDGFRDGDERGLVLGDEVGQYGHTSGRSNGGQQGMRAVGFNTDIGGREHRLEPLGFLEHLIGRRVDEQWKASQILNPLDPELPSAEGGTVIATDIGRRFAPATSFPSNFTQKKKTTLPRSRGSRSSSGMLGP
ncbi:MAG TPA: hypothetical protein VJM31_02210 [Vicinamibacterales bacterium]|nr:hypothetical protein [Vicinamibacterales bacterium]